MSRARLNEVVLQGMPDHLQGVDGATVQVTPRNGGDPALYQDPTSSATWTNPLTTRDGRIEPVPGAGEVWLEAGSYDLIVSYGAGQDTASFEAVVGDETVFKDTNSRIDAKVAFNAAPSANVWLRIGSGTGTLTDNATDGPMGLKVKFDSVPGDEPSTPAQANLNIVAGSAPGAVQGFISRIDVNDTSSGGGDDDGDTVALWGDVFIRSASNRPTWGLNTYVSIEPGSGYLQAAVGAEVGVNNEDVDNGGGILQLVSHGTATVQFGIRMGSLTGAHRVRHNLLMSSVTPPQETAIYYGPVGTGNVTAGTALFKVDAAGSMWAGPVATFGQTLAPSVPALQVQRTADAFPRAQIHTDGRHYGGGGTADPDVVWGRASSNIFAVGLTGANVLQLSTAALANASATAYLSMFQLSGDPTAAVATGGRLYLKNVGGKTALMIRFPSGSPVQIAIEP